MKQFIAIAAMLLVAFLPQHATSADQCLTCHEALGDKPSQLFKQDVHRAKGITCAGCHGGNALTDDMEKAMSKGTGFIGVPKGDAISAKCAECHSDPARMKQYGSSLPTNQLELLHNSVHGKLSVSGGEHIAQCTTCHGAHGVASVNNPRSPVHPVKVTATCSSCHSSAAYMRTYNPSLPVDQLEKYRTSLHGQRNAKGDANVAECASCHGSHSILRHTDAKSAVYPLNLPGTCAQCHTDDALMKKYNLPTDQYAKFAGSVHGQALLKKQDLGAPACNDCHGNHGAMPPGVESISKVCGSCHGLNADLFAASPHKRAFDEKKLPECATCHNNHDIAKPTHAMAGTAQSSTCIKCHSATDSKAYNVAGTMKRLIDSLDRSEAHAAGLVDEGEQKGMSVTDAKFTLRTVRQARLETRTVLHAFDIEKFSEVVNKGLASSSSVTNDAQQAIGEYYFRRIGLGISTLIITLLACTLFFYIRRIERRQQAGGTTTTQPTH